MGEKTRLESLGEIESSALRVVAAAPFAWMRKQWRMGGKGRRRAETRRCQGDEMIKRDQVSRGRVRYFADVTLGQGQPAFCFLCSIVLRRNQDHDSVKVDLQTRMPSLAAAAQTQASFFSA